MAADGEGGYVPCLLGISSGSSPPRRGSAPVRLEPQGDVSSLDPPVRPIAVGFALHKGERPDWAVQKLTELGIDRLLLLISERTVVRPADGSQRSARLAKVARQAAAQSRRVRLPSIEGPFSYDEALEHAPVKVAVADPGAPPIATGTSSVLVGPEGGFTPGELERATSLVGLAETILRTETAAVAAGVLLSGLRSGRIGVATESRSVAN